MNSPTYRTLGPSLGTLAALALATATMAGCWTRVLPAIGSGSGGMGMVGGGSGGSFDGGMGGGRMGDSGVVFDGPGIPFEVGSAGGSPAMGGPTLPGKLDVLFMVDDSMSMAPLQAKMQAGIPAFIDGLVDPVTGKLPDLHVAVITSSLGGGAWGNVNQCGSGSHPGDDQGFFQQGPGGASSGSCAMLHSGATFLDTGDGLMVPPNFDGDIRDALKCTAYVGDTGCGFESQFKSTYYALQYAAQPRGTGVNQNLQNGGFLRPDARLAIIMLTNEDDCSVANNSLLLDPAVNSVSDPTGLGALWSYRCNEFGHLCAGAPPPHGAPPAGGVTLMNCVSAENSGKTDSQVTDPNGNPDPTQGHLWPTVGEFTSYIRSIKADPKDIFVAAIAGPPTPYRVVPTMNAAAMGELDPAVEHSCTQAAPGGATEYADPAVRIKQWTDSFGASGAFYPICADSLNGTMANLAAAIHARLGS